MIREVEKELVELVHNKLSNRVKVVSEPELTAALTKQNILVSIQFVKESIQTSKTLRGSSNASLSEYTYIVSLHYKDVRNDSSGAHDILQQLKVILQGYRLKTTPPFCSLSLTEVKYKERTPNGFLVFELSVSYSAPTF